MKTVDFETWQKLPVGTVFAEWTPSCTMGDWSIKGSTGADDTALYDAPIIDTYQLDEVSEGQEVPFLETPIWSRATGCYYGLNRHGQPHRFLVLSPQDLLILIATLHRCIDGCP